MFPLYALLLPMTYSVFFILSFFSVFSPSSFKALQRNHCLLFCSLKQKYSKAFVTIIYFLNLDIWRCFVGRRTIWDTCVILSAFSTFKLTWQQPVLSPPTRHVGVAFVLFDKLPYSPSDDTTVNKKNIV